MAGQELLPKNAGREFEIIRHARLPLCLTDPNQPDNPIIFANSAFCELTGFSQTEVIGKNCRFLQGPDTTESSIEKVRQVIRDREVATLELVNYRKDGTRFINALQIGPIFGEDGSLQYFFGSQLDITEKRNLQDTARKLAEDEVFHRLRNVVNVMSVMVRLTAKKHADVPEFGRRLVDRLKALSDAHFTTSTESRRASSVHNVARAILAAYAPIEEDQFSLSGPHVELSSALVSVVSLALHELATNAVKHGALGADSGHVTITWESPELGGNAWLFLEWHEHGGPEPSGHGQGGGTDIIERLVSASGGGLEFDWQATGLVAKLRIPLDIAGE